MDFTIKTIPDQPTPTGIGTTRMFAIVRADGTEHSRYWNRRDASSNARYLNKYGEPTKRTSNNYGLPAIMPR